MDRANVALLVLVMALWSLCYPLITLVTGRGAPLGLAALRAFIAAICLLAPAAVLRRPMPRGGRVWVALGASGLGATTLGFAGMFLAGGRIAPGIATVLSNAQPLLAAALAVVVLRERPGPSTWAALGVGFAGIALIAASATSARNTMTGVVLVLAAACGVAGGNVAFKGLAGKVDPFVAMGTQLLVGAAALAAAALAVAGPGAFALGAGALPLVVAMATLGTAVPFYIWFVLLERGDLVRLNTFSFLTPVFGLAIGWRFFGEHVGALELGGSALVVASAGIAGARVAIRAA